MFVGRTEELELIKKNISQPGKALMVYGKRKIGKTTLIKESLKDDSITSVYFECIKGSLTENLQNLSSVLSDMNLIPQGIEFTSMEGLFSFLGGLGKRIVIVIDEYPYLHYREDPAYVDSVFQRVIDNHLEGLNLILSGSHISMMRSLLEEKNALYGRFSAVIKLQELHYKDASQFYPAFSPYDKIAFYCIFGGSPYINDQLDPAVSLQKNIVDTILNENHPIHLYASHLLLSDLTDGQGLNAQSIFSVLGNGKKAYSQIESMLKMNKTGRLNRQLKVLMDMELVDRRLPINRPEDDKKALYEISDNLIRFYYSYIYRNRGPLTLLGPQAFYDQYIAPSLNTFISYRFESLCRQFFSLLAKSGKLTDVRNIGTYYYDDPTMRKSGEFDVVIERSDGYTVCEVKYLRNPMTVTMQQTEAEKIRSIPFLPVSEIAFISATGFEGMTSPYQYIDGEDLYADTVGLG